MKSSKKLQISSHMLFVYINNQDRKWRMSVLVFSSALVHFTSSSSEIEDVGIVCISLQNIAKKLKKFI